MSGKPLTELTLKALKPKEKVYSLSDGNGLIIEVRPSGSRYWIIRYWVGGKEHRKSLGTYPEVSLKEARLQNADFRRRLGSGEDMSGRPKDGDTFGEIAEEWHQKHSANLDPAYSSKVHTRLEKYIYPRLAEIPIRELTSSTVLDTCRVMEDLGAYEIAHRIRQIIGMVCRYAIASGRSEIDPTSALKGALHPVRNQHHATIVDREGIGDLLRRIDAYPGRIVRAAMLFSVYTIARPGEVRQAEWTEIEGDLWKIPETKMKMRRPHLVPLCAPALALLRVLRANAGRFDRYLFPSARNDGRCMSNAAVRVALRSMGYEADDMSAHGVRAMASTVLHENGWPTDVIERQLAHADRSATRAAYNHAEYLPQRREMMQWWGDWLESVKKAPA